jgi:CRISPR-associated endonuclease/helicase Cas3
MYEECRETDIESNISYCDAPTGTGKTTAIMAHMLKQAAKRGLRRIIVVLPFTNIITQSVEVYRKALVLPREDPQKVVAELHHCADFDDIHIRHLTALWKAPIIVTTAVSFFETLSSNSPSTLRRLHNLPGSAIFIDESHAALPAEFLSLAWHWIRAYAEEWGCYWVLASGSLNKFWEIRNIDSNKPNIPNIISEETRKKLIEYELSRVDFRYNTKPLDIDSVVDFVNQLPGPRLLILNTVQSAAIIALTFSKKFGRRSVEHISGALTPKDRKNTLNGVKDRLLDTSDVDWTLVATSCVQAGVDLSFRSGIMEICSLISLLQTGGRVNRNGYYNSSSVWVIRLDYSNNLLRKHPLMGKSIFVLMKILKSGIEITPNLCTRAFKKEMELSDGFYSRLVKDEENMNFPAVERDFKVIDSNTKVVVVDNRLCDEIERCDYIDWRKIQNNSVQIFGHLLKKLSVPEIRKDLYRWHLEYDDFVGYMLGYLKELDFSRN